MFLPRQTGLWRYSIFYLIVLSIFFFSTYGFANWVTALRSDVGTAVFNWEKQIPLWPWTIIPYWSIDLFYGFAILLAPTKLELNNLVKRLFTAQFICIIAFLLWPLMFSFQRPILDGYFGMLFDILMGFDKPYNQAPSLHITLLVILWVFYAQHLKGWLRYFLHLWFSLIGISVLTTWQHHFLDVPLGALTGAICVWLWPADRRSIFYKPIYPKQWRWATLYFVNMVISVIIAYWLGGWALWLLWLSAALAIATLSYGIIGANGFQKQKSGQFEPVVGGLLLPYRCIMRINSQLWTRGQPAFNHVVDNLYIGKLPTKRLFTLHPFAAVIDLCAELAVPVLKTHYTLIPVLDMTVPSIEDCEKGVQAIDAARHDGDILVCCALGYSRSATIVLAWLLVRGFANNVEQAIAILKKARPHVVINDKHLNVLNQWERLINEK